MRGIKRVNPFGIVGSLLAIAVFLLSVFYHHFWWEISVGDNVGHVGASALNYEIDLLGISMEVKILWFINLIFQMLLVESAIALMTYSVAPDRDFSEKLLKFSYLKPLSILISFVGFLLVLFVLLPSIVFHTVIPLSRSSTISISIMGLSVDIPIASSFTTYFWLMVVTTVFYIAAYTYHKKYILEPAEKEKAHSEEF